MAIFGFNFLFYKNSMIKKSIACLGLGAGIVFFTPSSLLAEEYPSGMYLSTGWGIGKIGDINFGTNAGTFIGVLRHSPGLEYEFGLGYDFGKRYRMDLTYGQTGQNYENSTTPAGYVDTLLSTLALNAYVDFPTESNLTPFIGLGIGSTRVDVSGGWDSAGSASLVLGGAYALTKRLDLEAKATFRGLSDLDFAWVTVTGAKNTSGLIGLRYKL